jgi:hypothetical protein
VKVPVEYIEDAFGTPVRAGDYVVYAIGDRWDRRLCQGLVEEIYEDPEKFYRKTTIKIRKLEDPQFPSEEGGISPLNHGSRIMRLA